jgi:hypothetical protein
MILPQRARLRAWLLPSLASALLAVWASAPSRPAGAGDPAAKPAEQEEPAAIDPMSANGACYVCHMTFVREEISKVHLAAKVGCTKCHGPSAKHANDENIGASKPDILYKHAEVDAMCKKCHETHDVPANKVVGRFVERKLAGTAACTDCHGTHKVDRAAEEKSGAGGQ